jgi:hypothetical protein
MFHNGRGYFDLKNRTLRGRRRCPDPPLVVLDDRMADRKAIPVPLALVVNSARIVEQARSIIQELPR